MIYIILILIIILIYTYAAYPLLLKVLNSYYSNPIKINESYQPEISVVIAAYNEEQYIENAIRSIYDSGYSDDKLSVYIGSDGSNDKTLDICYNLEKEYANLNIFDYPRAGKNLTINKLVPKTTTDIIFFLDADCRLTKDALNKMVTYFYDESVGIVLGSSIHEISDNDNDDTGRMGDISYHSFERDMRIYESNIQTTVNSFGPFYGIKREIYEPIPNNRVCDDFLPILRTARKKKRVIFNPDVFVLEVRPKSLIDEFNRRVRSVSCGMASLWLERKVLSFEYNWVPFFLLSHKLLRWFTPFILIFLALATVMLPDNSFWKAPIVWIQIIFYLFSLLGWFFDRIKIKIFPFNFCLFFILMNMGMFIAFFRFITGMSNAIWSRETKK
jgi:poly-beta-1,6-N-acetyl-D-glucosamine synthase